MADPPRKIGDYELIIAGRERAGRLAANRIIVELVGWYEGVRRDYAAKD